jgi:hypothetical protein
VTAISDANKGGSAKRWLGYTCPECFAIFRVPVEGQGKVAECPHCDLQVILGHREIVADAAAVVGAGEEDGAESVSWERSERSGRLMRKKRVSKKIVNKSPDWDNEVPDLPPREGRVLYLVLLVGLLFMTAGAGVFLKQFLESREQVVRIKTAPQIIIPGVEAEKEEFDSAEILGENFEMNREIKRLTEVVEGFLKAPDLATMLGYVRDRKRVEPLVRGYYALHDYAPSPYRELAPFGNLKFQKSFLSIDVEMEDFSSRPIAVEKTKEGYLVDWESWVGYCEMPWAELRRVKPTKPVLMRVRVSSVSYYNFNFSDDRKWESYHLTDVSDEYSVYGYVEKYSELAGQLAPAKEEGRSGAMIVRLRFPEEAMSDNQVFIEDIVTVGWVLPLTPVDPAP